MVVVLRGVGWECLCLCRGKGKKVPWEGSLRVALEPHKTGQVDIMYTFQFEALAQVQER